MAKLKELGGGAVKFVRGSFIDGIRGWIATLIIAPVSALGVFLWNTPIDGQSGADRWRDATQPLPAPADPADYVVLVGNFAGDADGAQARRIAADLSDQFGEGGVVQVTAFPRLLRLQGDDVGAARAAAEARGRRWLERQQADILVWGEVRPATGELEVRLLRAQDASRATYSIADLKAPAALSGQVGTAIAGLIAADAAPAYANGRFTANVLARLVERLRPVAASAGANLKGEARALVLLSFADASAQLGAQTGRTAPLEDAVIAYRRAIAGLDAKTSPQIWATAQSNLGVALQALGRNEPGPERLEQAIAAFRAALDARPRRDAPLEWAATQTNLGLALAALGEREERPDRLREAAAAHREALKEFSRARSPLDWAATQSNLGATLVALGDRGENGRYSEAAGVLRQALEERTRARAPLDWASTQHNLGAALAGWGERGGDVARLDEALAAYRAALEERTRARDAAAWAASQAGLARTLRLIGEKRKDAKTLNEAVAAYHATVAGVSRTRAPIEWAIAQNGLGNAHESLGDLGAGVSAQAHYQTAQSAFELARDAFNAAQAPGFAAVAEENLKRIKRKIARPGSPLGGLFNFGD